MGIEATSSSSTVSSTTSSAQVSSASNSDSAKKTSTDSSFKDEMDKVSSKEDKKDSKVEETKSKDVDKTQTSETNKKDAKEDDDNLTLNGNADYSQYGSLSINDANKMLSSDIMQMMAQNGLAQASETASSIFSFGSDNTNQVSLTQNDAQFFINLTKSEDVSGQNIALQAQNMIANGGDFAEVAQNAKISQTLLNALSNARETNQPLRIDFDQNVSVILRIGQDGALSARFIPGDKAVEQYLRNNIESLKATFRENDLPYSDLSYSNSSKQQNERRRNKQQQGE